MNEQGSIMRAVSAIYDAVLASAENCDGGSGLDYDVAKRGLTAVLGMLMESHPAAMTPKALRESCVAVGQEVHLQAKHYRREFEQTGQRCFWVADTQIQ